MNSIWIGLKQRSQSEEVSVGRTRAVCLTPQSVRELVVLLACATEPDLVLTKMSLSVLVVGIVVVMFDTVATGSTVGKGFRATRRNDYAIRLHLHHSCSSPIHSQLDRPPVALGVHGG